MKRSQDGAHGPSQEFIDMRSQHKSRNFPSSERMVDP